MSEPKTPGWVDKIIDAFAPDELAEEIKGDLYELFVNDIQRKSIRYARKKYTFNAIGFLSKRFFWKRDHYSSSNPFVMFGSYFKMARRSLLAYKETSLINIIGLVIGIASALVLLTVIRYEMSFNHFHSDTDRIYRVVRVSGEDMTEFRTGVSYPVPAAFKEEITALQEITSMEYFGGAYVDVMDAGGKSVRMFREDFGCVLVEPSFLKVFDFKETDFRWISGNPEKALVEPFSVVLTESMAKKYFPEGSPIGKALRFEKFFDAKITGVISDFPPNSDFPFTILVSYASLRTIRGEERLKNWFGVSDSHHTFIKLPAGSTSTELEEQFERVHRARTPKDLHTRHYLLQPLKEMHYDARFGTYTGRTISKSTVVGLGLVALFLLITAAINYINLATAQSTLRSKEVGLRKVMGGLRANLAIQFLVETFVIVLLSGILALLVSEVALIQFESLLNLRLVSFHFLDPFVVISLCIIVLIVTILAGVYPSLVISRMNPIAAMKNSFLTNAVGSISLRKLLVVGQFTLTQILVVGTFIVVYQLHVLRTADLGFSADAVITVNFPNTSTYQQTNTVAEQLRSQSFASAVTLSSTLPSGLNRSRSSMGIARRSAQNGNEYKVFEMQMVDPNFIEMFKIKLLAGRNLTEGDSTGNIVINRALMKELELGTDPSSVLGQELKIGQDPVVVVGVVEDYYSNSFKEEAGSIVLLVNRKAYDYCSIKLSATDPEFVRSAINKVERVWASSFPEHIFDYKFLDENVKQFYLQEEKMAKLFQLFSVVFLIIGSLGLYGLITFVVNRKSKEVAIRKVLGAKLGHILIMFSGEYIMLIALSFILALPVAYYGVNLWLTTFVVNRISLQWYLFALPGLIVLVIAILIVIAKSFRTANTNPVSMLKHE